MGSDVGGEAGAPVGRGCGGGSLVPGVFHHVDAPAEHRFDDLVLRAEVVVEQAALMPTCSAIWRLGHAGYPVLEDERGGDVENAPTDVDGVDHGHGGDLPNER